MKVFLIAQVENKLDETTNKVFKTYKKQAFIEAETAATALAKFTDSTKGLGQILDKDYEVSLIKSIEGIIKQSKTGTALIFTKTMSTGKVYLFPVDEVADLTNAAFQGKNDVVKIAPQEITNLEGTLNVGYLF